MATVACRVCLSGVQPKHSIALFSDRGLENKWSDRIIELLHVPVSASDNFPQHICRSCKDRVESLEKKLTSLRQLARESYERLSSELTRTRKRAKDTSSGQGVSPATARARHPAKRANTLQGKQLLIFFKYTCR